MVIKSKISNITADEARRVIAALAANLPPPEDVKPRRAGALCAYARDLGETAFPAFPCRGHRVECAKTGLTSYAAKCRSDLECTFYSERA